MKTSIQTREIITLDAAGIRILGTHHKPHEHRSSSALPIAVLFLNPGTLPRAATGDSAVYWAESFAALGYHSFRLDLPGMGDTEGDLPEKLIDFQSSVNTGDYAPLVALISGHLVDRFNLSGLVVVGLCAGAVTSLFAAVVDERIKGLVLMDPYFNLQGETAKAAETTVSQTQLPGTANLPLIDAWKQVASSERPILVLCSPSTTAKSGAFDYLGYLLEQSDRRNRLNCVSVDGTNHSFAEGAGKDAVRHHTERWLMTNFPLAARMEAETTGPHCEIPERTDRTHGTLLAPV